MNGGRPVFDSTPLDYYAGESGYSVSDFPVTGGGAFRASAAPAPLQSQTINVALASNGGVASASSTHPSNSLAAVNNGDRRGPNFGGIWSDNTSNVYPDWVQIDFNGLKVIDEVALFSMQNGYPNSVEPTETLTGSQYVVTSFLVQYWNGSQWATVPGGSITGNNLIWRRVIFPELSTTKIRITINATGDNYSQVPEVEVYGQAVESVNVALASNGGMASASSTHPSHSLAAVNNGDRRGPNFGGIWADNTNNVYPDWVQIDFNGMKVIDEVALFSMQNGYPNSVEPTETLTGSQYVVTSFLVQYWNGSQWATVPGGSITGNNLIWRRVIFPELSTTKIRITINATGDNYSQVPEVEVYGTDPAGVGLTAEYYDNLDFTSYKLTRTDATVNFDWANGAPDPLVGPEEFSVRWTGMVVPRYSETYTFYTTSDDGVRLWVDGQLIVDKWIDQAATEWSGQIALQAGRAYSIKMEFYDRLWGAVAKLKWSSASQLKEVIPQTQLYGCWKSSGQFTRDFHQGALARQPYAGELQDWSNQLTQAQGDSQLVAVAQALGANVFNSSEYAARNRSDHDYVGDIYWAYLQRAPDQAGWDFWTNQIAACGADQQCRATKRADVRAAFDQSGEFQDKVRRLCGTSAAAPDNGGVGYNFSTARLDPSNRTGGGGADPLSRNFNWSVPLVSLPGRANLDLGLSLSYNSLVWTKDATGVTFDADRGFPSPGFRLGFPSIQPKFFNPQTGKYAYLLVTPSGGHVELRQVGTSNVYESADSSYLQLTEAGSLTLLTTDGTRLSFWLVGGEYRCTEVKDRNGNYLTVAYYGDGRIDRVIDTLGRTITFNYDTYQNLISITQPWKRQTEANPTGVDEVHTWATFGYTNLTLQPSFTNLAVMGDQPGTVIPVVTQVGLGDGSYYKLSYNGWGQVWKVTHFAADSVNAQGVPNDSHALSYSRLNLPGSDLLAASPQTDCPRFTEQRTWVENGVMNQSAEVTTSYSAWTPNMASCDTTPPDPTPNDPTDNTVYRDLYATAGWQKGLTSQKEAWVNGVRKKWTALSWTQDDTNAAYKINPRVYDATVNDSDNNHRRTSVTFTSFGLPQEVTEYAANTTTPLRTTRTEYNLSTEYTSRRIIGLPSFQYLYEGTSTSGTLRSKVGYVYDDNTLPNYLQALPSSATQHDGASYGTALRWRGNANGVRRYDVTGGAGTNVESQAGYNVTGTVAFSKDASGHQTTISYADSFFQGVNRSNPVLQTFAYATTVTDPDLFTSSTWYNYDMAVVTQSETPLPNVPNDQPGPTQKRLYDKARRAIQATNSFNAARTKWVYPSSMNLVQTFTLLDVDPAPDLEAYTVSLLDGAGRVRASAGDLPGSAGGYSGQLFNYDSMGRLVGKSNPTETTAAGASWLATGADAPAGWLYTQQTYDWNGRPLVTTNTDTTTRTASYSGCGCAGGEVVTLTDEGTGVAPNIKKRQQKIYSDVLGRTWKTEILDWNGTGPNGTGPNNTVYSATVNAYNARDQITTVKQYSGAATSDGSCPSGTCQETIMSYDGHGRLQTRHLPQQAPGTNTAWEYNADDTILKVTDARNASRSFQYNNRHLVNSITYAWPGGGPVPGEVTFGYDAAGNRISMTDGLGSAGYAYDQMSRMTSESRTFDVGTFNLGYEYNLAAQLTKITDHFGAQVGYVHDTSGRVTAVTSANFGTFPTYASNIQYRASGAIKAMDYGNTRSLSMTYNARLQPASFSVPGVMSKTYDYQADGRLKFSHDLLNPQLDRSYAHDHAGRITEALSGGEARNEGPTNSRPYQQTSFTMRWVI